jgi:hypothetical protein
VGLDSAGERFDELARQPTPGIRDKDACGTVIVASVEGSRMGVIDLARFERLAGERHAEFRRAEPYPHSVIDDFLPADVADRCLEEFENTSEGWNSYRHYNEDKKGLTKIERMGPMTQKVFAELQSQPFIALVGKLSGIEELVPDPDLDGGGMHNIERGGFLNVHTDFLSHTKNRHWSRQINLLVYFNKDWRKEWNGELELWDDDMSHCVRSIAPIFNRCVIFHTREKSFHGHPAKLACPPGISRKSFALYYFRDEGKKQTLAPTNYRATPQDGLARRALIAADRMAVRVYSFLKRYTGLSDTLISRITKR